MALVKKDRLVCMRKPLAVALVILVASLFTVLTSAGSPTDGGGLPSVGGAGKGRAIDLGVTSKDNIFGWGRLNTGDSALLSTPAATTTATGEPALAPSSLPRAASPVNVSQNPGESFYPAVATDSSGNVHIVWIDNTPGNPEILYRRWSGGGGWSNVENLSQNSGNSRSPALAADASGNVHVVWEDDTAGNAEIFYSSFPVPGAAAPTPTPWAGMSTPTPTAGANQIQLTAGWNLTSVPTAQRDASVSAVFAQCPAVTKVNAVQDGGWTFAARGAEGWAGTLTQIVDGKGYYVYATEAATLMLSPKLPDPLAGPPSYSLPTGWSMIGYTSSIQTMPVGSYLASLEGKWTTLFWYDATKGWQLAKPGGLGFTHVEMGKGYWIYLTAVGTLVP